MAEVAGIAYRAFISHARADAGWARWLHRRLEDFPIGEDLVGVRTSRGVVPAWLGPVFRGQEHSDARRELGYKAISALYASTTLIVLCSPASARSDYVSETVHRFKTRHPERLVIPVIIDGEPGGGERECYPGALRFRLDRDEQIIAAPASLLAVDLRPGHDSREVALAKIAARMLGFPRYDLFRPPGGGRGRGRLRAALALAVAFVIVVGALNGRETLRWAQEPLRWAKGSFARRPQSGREEVGALVRRLGKPREASPDPRRGQESLTVAVAAIFDGARTDRRYAAALEFLKSGRMLEAGAVLRALAEDEAAGDRAGAQRAAGKFHCLGVIAGLADPRIALEAYGRAAALDPANLEWQRDFALGYGRVAEYYWRSGEQGMAALALREGKGITERMIKLAPDDAEWRKDLAWFSRRITELRKGAAAGNR